MKKHLSIPSRRAARRVFLSAAIVTLSLSLMESAGAEARYTVRPTEGGLSPTPDITAMESSNNEVTIKFNGFGGPYQVEKLLAPGGQWAPVGSPTSEKSAKVPGDGHHAFFRVRGPAPGFAGSEICAECHGSTAHHWSQTRHATALESLKAIGQGANAACLKCHTVGFGLSTGFSTEAQTPYFSGVQCESCHGPSASHANNPDDPLTRPIVAATANLCGGCHEGDHHPTFSEWKDSRHAHVDAHVQEYFHDAATGTARMQACGACHSSAVRSAMMKSVATGELNLPTAEEAAETTANCTSCHSSHSPTTTAGLLRNPQGSTKFFSYNTGTSTSFRAQYDPSVQLCGQCHNQRGASPNDAARPPHHSPQYNVLIGNIGTELGYAPATVEAAHTKLQDQCSHCHTSRQEPAVVTAENKAYTGHRFSPALETCASCHDSVENAAALTHTVQGEIRARIQAVKEVLDTWAATKAPEALRTKYGKLGWEYASVGQISNPDGAAMSGPSTAEQAVLPIEIKKARMWVYMIEHDGSYGVHNPKFARYLLDEAEKSVNALISAP